MSRWYLVGLTLLAAEVPVAAAGPAAATSPATATGTVAGEITLASGPWKPQVAFGYEATGMWVVVLSDQWPELSPKRGERAFGEIDGDRHCARSRCLRLSLVSPGTFAHHGRVVGAIFEAPDGHREVLDSAAVYTGLEIDGERFRGYGRVVGTLSIPPDRISFDAVPLGYRPESRIAADESLEPGPTLRGFLDAIAAGATDQALAVVTKESRERLETQLGERDAAERKTWLRWRYPATLRARFVVTDPIAQTPRATILLEDTEGRAWCAHLYQNDPGAWQLHTLFSVGVE